MKNNINSILTTTFAVLMVTLLGNQNMQAQDEAPTFSVSGTVDTYYRSTEFAPGTSFANLNGFALGMANIVLSYEGEKSGFVADLVYGPRGADAVFNSVGSSNLVNQLYVYYNVSDSFTLTLGNFNTFLGYEVISPAANFNYSTSYMFSYGPFSHTGLKADITLSDDISLMLGVLNSTDQTEAQPIGDDYMFGAQLGLYGQYINLLTGGSVNATQIDFTGGIDLSDSFFLGVNATTYEDDTIEFSGIALYPQYTFSDSFALGARYEAFTENGELGAFGDGDNTSFTITGSLTSGNMTIKPEFRVDTASDKFYTNADGATDSLASFVVAAIYSF
ncbi:MAG: outer membrane beta-barrel protein [Bacteroidetes bacterium]|nr:outer membrane beta-barrel protein [Bacteroidota bacterium]